MGRGNISLLQLIAMGQYCLHWERPSQKRLLEQERKTKQRQHESLDADP